MLKFDEKRSIHIIWADEYQIDEKTSPNHLFIIYGFVDIESVHSLTAMSGKTNSKIISHKKKNIRR